MLELALMCRVRSPWLPDAKLRHMPVVDALFPPSSDTSELFPGRRRGWLGWRMGPAPGPAMSARAEIRSGWTFASRVRGPESGGAGKGAD